MTILYLQNLSKLMKLHGYGTYILSYKASWVKGALRAAFLYFTEGRAAHRDVSHVKNTNKNKGHLISRSEHLKPNNL